MSEETDTERLSNLPRVTTIIHVELGIKPGQSGFRVHAFNYYTTLLLNPEVNF